MEVLFSSTMLRSFVTTQSSATLKATTFEYWCIINLEGIIMATKNYYCCYNKLFHNCTAKYIMYCTVNFKLWYKSQK